MCSKFYRINNIEVIRQELQVFNINEILKDCKQWWKERVERMPNPRLGKQI